MKAPFLGLVAATALMSAPAYAGNRYVEDAIHDRADLTVFYQLLTTYKIFDKLDENTEYTIFAPTDQAFKRMPQDKYACVYNGTCAAEAVPILLNHFAVSTYTDEDIIHNEGGIDSIDDGRLLHISKSGSDYAIDGNRILSSVPLYHGIMYKLDGIIADNNEVMALQNPKAPVVADAAPQPQPQPADTMCEMEDCSDQPQLTPASATMPADAVPAVNPETAASHPVLPWQRPQPAVTQPQPQAAAVHQTAKPVKLASTAKPTEANRKPTVKDVFEPDEAENAPTPQEELHVLRLPDPNAPKPLPPGPPVAAPYVDVASSDLAPPSATVAEAAPAASVGPVGGPVQLTAQVESEHTASQTMEAVAHTQMASAQPAILSGPAPGPHPPYMSINFRSPAAD